MIPSMPQLSDLPRIPEGLIEELRRDPSYALETLAFAAVDVHGPAAQQWLQSRGPMRYSKEQLAKSAVQRARNTARVEGAALGLGGFVTIAPDAVALVWILTREVIFVAAAYGLDPTDRARAAELLVVLEVYDTVEEAQAGLDRQGTRLASALAQSQVTRRLSPSDKSMSHRITRFAAKRAAKRYGGRLVPGLGAVLGAIDNAAAATATGERAIAFYAKR
jgi:hypothetical protein